MAYTQVSISTPNDFLVQLSVYAQSVGWSVLYEGDDLPIDGTATSDGKRLVIKSPSKNTIAHFRSANGKGIFPTHNHTSYCYGIGLTCSTGFKENPASGLWYDQIGVITNSAQAPIGVGIPLLSGTAQKVYFNHTSEPSELIIASVEVYAGFFLHVAIGEAYKIGSWTGGTICSASMSSADMFPSQMTKTILDTLAVQLFSTSLNSNTFLRANIDSAPLRLHEVLWAGSGTNETPVSGYTGKHLATPIVNKNALSTCPKIPHYGYLQSQSSTDSGRNVNTLNCISVNLPIALYVLRDPDALKNYSQCAYVPGMFCISMKNLAPKSTYNVDYPSSGVLYQAFPQTTRGGSMGYDGISIIQ